MWQPYQTLLPLLRRCRAEAGERERVQFVISVDMEQWEAWRAVVEPGSCLMRNRPEHHHVDLGLEQQQQEDAEEDGEEEEEQQQQQQQQVRAPYLSRCNLNWAPEWWRAGALIALCSAHVFTAPAACFDSPSSYFGYFEAGGGPGRRRGRGAAANLLQAQPAAMT
jgi:hypothetical protein